MLFELKQHVSSKRRSITQLCLRDKVERFTFFKRENKTHPFSSAAQWVLSLKLHEMLKVLDTKPKYWIIIIYIKNAWKLVDLIQCENMGTSCW